MKVLLAQGADARARDDRHRLSEPASAADNQARQTRDQIVSATTGRATSIRRSIRIRRRRARRRSQVSTGRGAAVDPDRARHRRTAGATARGRRPDIEQIGRQGGFTALHYAARDGFAGAACCCSTPAWTSTRRPTAIARRPMVVAIINGQYDLALTLPRARRQSESGQRRWRRAAVCGAQQRVGAAHVVSAADRRLAAEGVVPAS